MTGPLIALSVPRLKVRKDHSHDDWPWREMTVEKVKVLDLLRLPSQTWPARWCTMRVGKLDFRGIEQVRVRVCVRVCVPVCMCRSGASLCARTRTCILFVCLFSNRHK